MLGGGCCCDWVGGLAGGFVLSSFLAVEGEVTGVYVFFCCCCCALRPSPAFIIVMNQRARNDLGENARDDTR